MALWAKSVCYKCLKNKKKHKIFLKTYKNMFYRKKNIKYALNNYGFFGSMCFFVSKISGKRVHLSSWNLQNRRAAALAIGSHRSLITSSLESTSRFIPSASPVLSRFTSSSTSQPISLIILALIIHHSFTLSLQAQKLTFSTNPFHLRLL